MYAGRHGGAVAAGSSVALLQSLANTHLLGKLGWCFGLTGAAIPNVIQCVSYCAWCFNCMGGRPLRGGLVMLALLMTVVVLAVSLSMCQTEKSPSLAPDLQAGCQPGGLECCSVALRGLPELNQLFQKTFRRNPEWSLHRHPGKRTFRARIQMQDCHSVEGDWESTEANAKRSALEHALRLNVMAP